MRGLAARMMAFDFAAHEWMLSFVAEQAGSTVSMATGSYDGSTGTPPTVFLEYSTNGYTWQTFTVGTTTVTLAKVGDTVWFRAPHGVTNAAFATSSLFNRFVLMGAVAARGSVMSLVNGDAPTFTLSSNLALAHLFYGCTALTAAPRLPATTLAEQCYYGTFEDCTSLTESPKLPATALAQYCYNSIFEGCTALTAAPELPATTMAEGCYARMFEGCTSLTKAPKIHATTLAGMCFYDMFEGCSALADVEVRFEDWDGDLRPLPPTAFWLMNVSATGTFRCPTALGTNDTIARGYNSCPPGWTVVNTD